MRVLVVLFVLVVALAILFGLLAIKRGKEIKRLQHIIAMSKNPLLAASPEKREQLADWYLDKAMLSYDEQIVKGQPPTLPSFRLTEQDHE